MQLCHQQTKNKYQTVTQQRTAVTVVHCYTHASIMTLGAVASANLLKITNTMVKWHTSNQYYAR